MPTLQQRLSCFRLYTDAGKKQVDEEVGKKVSSEGEHLEQVQVGTSWALAGLPQNRSFSLSLSRALSLSLFLSLSLCSHIFSLMLWLLVLLWLLVTLTFCTQCSRKSARILNGKSHAQSKEKEQMDEQEQIPFALGCRVEVRKKKESREVEMRTRSMNRSIAPSYPLHMLYVCMRIITVCACMCVGAL
jgi:hypothetical protein